MSQVFDRLQIARTINKGVHTAEVANAGLNESYLHVIPPEDNGNITQQTHAIYDRLFQTLKENDTTHNNLISQKLFFSNLAAQYAPFEAARKSAYEKWHWPLNDVPTITYLQQQPVQSGRCIELQAHILRSEDPEPLTVQSLSDLPGLASGTVIDSQGLRHIHLCNLTGESDDLAMQVDTMFTTAEAALNDLGASFHDVVRTWIYLPDLEGDYDDFNPVRTHFFNRIGLSRIPASTGIQGGTYPADRKCMMDLYALLSDDSVQVAPMHAKTMNEAPEYGSSFARGMTVTRNGQITAYVSGTASINDQGEVMHIGDIEGQANRMFQNVEALLEAQNASLKDVVSAVTYLKHPDYLDTFNRVAQERGLPISTPNAITVADVCRPKWLCEIEVIAVFPKRV